MSSFHDTWSRHDFSGVASRIQNLGEPEVFRALDHVGGRLTQDDLAALLSPAAVPHLETMASLSQQLTIERFGRTMQLYAPLYLSNACKNICSYCGFSAHNKIRRKTLTPAEIDAEAEVLAREGFEHILLVTGESSHVGVDYIAAALRRLRSRFASLSMEVQPLSTEEYARLVGEGLSAVLVYQETYDKDTYREHHHAGPKTDMRFRLETPDRLGAAGVKKIGLSPLYGLADWRADAWFAGLHLRYLEQTYWKTKYSLSFPRLRPHAGDSIRLTPFNERDLIQAATAFRLFSPELELALSTREGEHFRKHAFRLGFTHLSAGSKTNPGGYANPEESLEQFKIDDDRPPAEVAAHLHSQGYAPVWKDWDPSFDGK